MNQAAPENKFHERNFCGLRRLVQDIQKSFLLESPHVI